MSNDSLIYGFVIFICLNTHLCVKRIIVQEVSTVECLAVCLIQGDYVLLSSEHLNLVKKHYKCITCNPSCYLIRHLQAAPGEAALSGD